MARPTPRPRRRRALSLLVVAAALGCGRQSSDPVIATFRGGEIRQSDLETWRGAGRYLSDRGKAPQRMDAVERLVLLHTASEEAIREGLEDDPAVAAAVAGAEQALLAAELRLAVIEEIDVPAGEIDAQLAIYDADRAKPERRTLSFILKRQGPGATGADPRAVLAAARARIAAGEAFAEVARELSDSPTRHRGGRLGTVRRGQLPPALDAVAFALAEGAVSDVVAGEGGYVILRCDTIHPAFTMSVAEARERIRRHLRAPRAERAWQALVDSLAAGRKLDRSAQDALLAAEARRRGIDRDPRVRQGLEWRRREVLARSLIRRRVEALMPEPTEPLLRAHHAQHAGEFERAERFELAVISRRLTPETARTRFAELAAAVAAIRRGELSFDAAARRLSEHPSAANGGRIGWVPRPQVAAWGPGPLRVVSGLGDDEISDVVQEQDRLWVFRRLGHEPPRPRAYEETVAAVRASFERLQRRALTQQVLQRTLAAAEMRRLREPARPSGAQVAAGAPAS